MKSSNEAKRRWEKKLKRTDPERYRRMRAEAQRRRRAKLYAAGRTSENRPVKDQRAADAKRQHVPHPDGCACYDCLFPPEPYRPTVHHAGVQS